MNEFDYIKNTLICSIKNTINKVTNTFLIGICEMLKSKKKLIPRIYREFQQINKKKQTLTNR